MFFITFSNGKKYFFERPISTLEVAKKVNPSLEKTCIAGLLNGKLINATKKINKNCYLTIITQEDELSLKIIRNSCAHLLGYAIKKLWVEAKMVIGSDIDNGFYYDIDLNHTLKKNDLIQLENCMQLLIKKKYNIINKKISFQKAKSLFEELGENYKINALNEKFNNKKIEICIHNEKYIDIIQSPCVPNVKFCKYFFLKNISGIYWKGNKHNKMLQRIQGVAWNNKNQLNIYLKNKKELTNRDHRKIGKQLELYHIQEESPGMIFWNHNGLIIFNELKSLIRSKLQFYQYKEVKSPIIMNRSLWENSGHWENYSNHMFITLSDNKEYCIKPMNCPGHVQIFNQKITSYRDLPIRIAEFGSCYRNEPSGSLHGLMRIRDFTQDDAHIFCTEDQICDEVSNCIKMMYDVYETFGFKKILVKLSTRPEKRIGNNDIWDKSEKKLASSLKNNNIDFEYQIGEGAFYGPKIEFILFDCLNRHWQCGTIQLDFLLPKNLNAFYVNKNNKKIVPVMIHRAILGSIERFIGILTEEFSGIYPTWLAPIQVVVMNISLNQLNYTRIIQKKLVKKKIRVKEDLRNKTIGFKIRDHTFNKIPYMIICGEEEMKNEKISLRTYKGKNFFQIDFNIFLKHLEKEIKNRNLKQLEEIQY